MMSVTRVPSIAFKSKRACSFIRQERRHSLYSEKHITWNFPQIKVTVFGGGNEKLPTWCLNHDWGVHLEYYSSSFLPADIGLVEIELKTFSIKVSSAVRALLECLYLAPKHQELVECYQLIEGLNNLRPNLVQNLLENCTSIKVKRLFLFLAEKANHGWVKHLNIEKIDLGSGKRSIVKNGVYISKYQITVPSELANGQL